jgi:hypothetical protein
VSHGIETNEGVTSQAPSRQQAKRGPRDHGSEGKIKTKIQNQTEETSRPNLPPVPQLRDRWPGGLRISDRQPQ